MPVRRDIEEARHQVILVTAALLADEGLEHLSIRRVAERAGYSTSIVTHYFSSKQDLVLATFHTLASTARTRVEEALATSDDRLLAALSALLPTNPDRVREWKMWTVYQGLSIGDVRLTEQWRARVESMQELLIELIAEEQRNGSIPPSAGAVIEARRLHALVNGIAFMVLLGPDVLTADQQVALVVEELRRLRASVTS